MKIDELLKRLDNVKIDEDERHKIAEYLAQKVSGKKKLFPYTLMMKDKKIYTFDSYEKLLKSNKISPNDAYVYLGYDYFTRYNPLSYFYPFLIDRYLLPNAYLSKLGLKSNLYHVAPATGLKYVVVVSKFPDINLMAIEVVDIDTVATNTYLPTLIHGDVRNKHIDNGEVIDIVSQFISQKLFAGYDFIEARDIIREYYGGHNTSLAKEVKAIRDAYNRIFKPLRIEFHLKTKQFIPT
jgi:hypothetical protein